MITLTALTPRRKHWFSRRFEYFIYIDFELYATGEGDYISASWMFTREIMRISKMYPDIVIDDHR